MDATPQPSRFEYLDALRGWAVLGVVVIHVGLNDAGFSGLIWSCSGVGARGVQLFFVVSAATLALSLAARRDRRPVLAFLTRRLFRVGPMFWVGVVFYLWWYGRAPRSHAPSGVSGTDIVATVVFAHGWSPARFNAVVPGGWTIAVEFNFYLLAPWLFVLARTPSRAAALVGVTWLLWLGLSVAHIPARWHPNASPGSLNFFSAGWLPAQLPVFALGFLAYHVCRPVRNDSRTDATVLLTVTPLLVLAGGGLVSDSVRYGATFALLLWGLRLAPVWPLVNPTTRFLGRISYSVYLLHFFCLDLARRLIGSYPFTGDGAGDGWASVWLPTPPVSVASLSPNVQFLALLGSTLALTVPLATLTHLAVELPGVAVGHKLIRRLGWGAN